MLTMRFAENQLAECHFTRNCQLAKQLNLLIACVSLVRGYAACYLMGP